MAPVSESGAVDTPPPISPSTSVLIPAARGRRRLPRRAGRGRRSLRDGVPRDQGGADARRPSPSPAPGRPARPPSPAAPAPPASAPPSRSATWWSPPRPWATPRWTRAPWPDGPFDLEGFLQFAEDPRRIASPSRERLRQRLRAHLDTRRPVGREPAHRVGLRVLHRGGREGRRGVRERPHRARRRGRPVHARGRQRAPVRPTGSGRRPRYGFAVTIRREGDTRLYYLTALYPTQLPRGRDRRPHRATAAAPAGRRLTHDEAMAVALEEAERAAAAGDVPVGAVVIAGGQRGRPASQRTRGDATTRPPTPRCSRSRDAAAEPRQLAAPRTRPLVVTLEPCPMCAGALVAARVRRVVFGAADPKAGAVRLALQPLRRPPPEPRGRRRPPACGPTRRRAARPASSPSAADRSTV